MTNSGPARTTAMGINIPSPYCPIREPTFASILQVVNCSNSADPSKPTTTNLFLLYYSTAFDSTATIVIPHLYWLCPAKGSSSSVD